VKSERETLLPGAPWNEIAGSTDRAAGFVEATAELESKPMDDRIYECEVKRTFMRNGEKVRDWKRVPVTDALADKSSDVRCAECHGAVTLHGRHVAHGPTSHAEHRSRQDSEYCPAGHYFKQNPGRIPRLSDNPIL
jgi:hypothetical protein